MFLVLFHKVNATTCRYFDMCRLDEGTDIVVKQKAEQKLSDADKTVPARGLVASEGWVDGAVAKKVKHTDSQKKEKRQRTLSLKTNKKMVLPQGTESPPLADMEGMLERKHLHQSGGKMATLRSWKHYYTVLAGQLLCFFKDHHGLYFMIVCILYCNNCCISTSSSSTKSVEHILQESSGMLCKMQPAVTPDILTKT